MGIVFWKRFNEKARNKFRLIAGQSPLFHPTVAPDTVFPCVLPCQYEKAAQALNREAGIACPPSAVFSFYHRVKCAVQFLLPYICTYWPLLSHSYCKMCFQLYLRVIQGTALFTFAVKMCYAHYEHCGDEYASANVYDS